MIGKYEQPGQPLQRLDLGEDRRGLLGPDHRDGDDRRAGAHRRLDEAAAAEAAQAVAVLVELLGALAALGEDEHELALVVEQAVHVGRVRRHGADLGQQHAEARIALEEVLDGEVSGRGWECSSLIALAIIAASGGSAPEWLETSSAPPSAGTFSIPSTSQRNHSL